MYNRNAVLEAVLGLLLRSCRAQVRRGLFCATQTPRITALSVYTAGRHLKTTSVWLLLLPLPHSLSP